MDAQIKAYRSSALKNMQVFGRPQGLRHNLMPRSNRALIKEWTLENPEEFKRLNNQLKKSVKNKYRIEFINLYAICLLIQHTYSPRLDYY